MNISTSGETIPKARNAYSVGKTAPKSPSEPLDKLQAIAAAASPHKEDIVREPAATSSRVLHCGHSMPLECAATFAAVISDLQCGQMRIANSHLAVRASNNKRFHATKKPANGNAVQFLIAFDNNPGSSSSQSCRPLLIISRTVILLGLTPLRSTRISSTISW